MFNSKENTGTNFQQNCRKGQRQDSELLEDNIIRDQILVSICYKEHYCLCFSQLLLRIFKLFICNIYYQSVFIRYVCFTKNSNTVILPHVQNSILEKLKKI